ncbi:MAG: DUF421 domain-containing protein [Ginsengibacter sp.]
MDWQEILFGKEDLPFILEVVFRTAIMFLLVVITLNFTGKRGVKQLSVFEMVMIISLGSAAGDPMFYKDVGILHALTVFIIILICYRLIIWLITKSEKMELFFEGKPLCLIQNGRFTKEASKHRGLGSDELFAELRNKNITHLGQIKSAILETNGTLSLLFFKDEEVKPWLPVWPDEFFKKSKVVSENGLSACANCGNTTQLSPASMHTCPVCEHDEWVKPCDDIRIT